MTKATKKVALAMSGGVDSSVAAWLLKQQGYDVVGIFMKNWSDIFALKSKECPGKQDEKDARQVAKQLQIPIKTFNFEKEYTEKVIDYFFKEYKNGRTPNPDVMCNKEIKFKVFFEKALTLGVDYIATGHYARVKHLKDCSELYKGIDKNKDQSYFLYAIDQIALQKTLFPIGGLTKPEVRKIASKLNLPVKDKPDSQGICFVGEVDLRQFLQQYIKDKPGNIINTDTKEVVGKHQGLAWYTIGQRKGMGVGGTGLPLYVSGKNIKKNELYVVKGNYNPKLYTSSLTARDLQWINKQPEFPNKYNVKIRYRQVDQTCKIKWLEKNKIIKVEFKEKQRAVTSGQSLVIYDKDQCLGGGIID